MFGKHNDICPQYLKNQSIALNPSVFPCITYFLTNLRHLEFYFLNVR
jgi:hypothetical protein